MTVERTAPPGWKPAASDIAVGLVADVIEVAADFGIPDSTAWPRLDAYITTLEAARAFVDRLAKYLAGGTCDMEALPTGLRKILAKLPDR